VRELQEKLQSFEKENRKQNTTIAQLSQQHKHDEQQFKDCLKYCHQQEELHKSHEYKLQQEIDQLRTEREEHLLRYNFIFKVNSQVSICTSSHSENEEMLFVQINK